MIGMIHVNPENPEIMSSDHGDAARNSITTLLKGLHSEGDVSGGRGVR